MPDNILLDNYEDDFPHIHPDMVKIKKKKTLYETLLIVKYRKEYYF